MHKLKRFYWQLRATKGLIVKWMCESLLAELGIKFRFFIRRKYEANRLERDLIVSLTSYPPRFSKLHLTLYSLIDQSYKPDKVVLWIAHQDRNQIPDKVKKLENKELIEIQYCEDLGPGKKIIPALVAYPESHIVTADDDICYQRNWLKTLINSWDGNTSTVVAHRVHRIKVDNSGLLLPYAEWEFDISDTLPHSLNFATGCGGVLYPVGCLHPLAVDKKLYMEACPRQDDIWLYWMEQMQSTRVKFSGHPQKLVSWLGSAKSSLASSNLDGQGNDECIAKLLKLSFLNLQKNRYDSYLD